MMRLEQRYTLRCSDFDCHDRLRPSAVLDLFQDIAGLHAQELQVDYLRLLEKKELWVLTKVRYRLLRQPHRYETVVGRTWPLEPGRVNFRREYTLDALDGTPLIRGSSEWVIVHSEKRRVMPVKDLYPGDDYCTDTDYPGRLAKIPLWKPEDAGHTIHPGFSQLDVNGHVNNIHYADYVMDALSPTEDCVVTELGIDYHREVLRDMPLTIHCRREEEGQVLSCGLDQEGQCMFCCQLTLSAPEDVM